MLSLLLLFLKGRKAPMFKAFNVMLLFISSILLIFLNLASYKPAKSFSEIYLVKVMANSTVLRTGYFKMCETTAHGLANTTSISCKDIHSFKNSGLAYHFAKNVVRPYFLVIATVVTIVAFVLCILTLVLLTLERVELITNITTFTALACTIITACWQQVAVQAAVVLIPQEVQRGHRAAGMVWSAVALTLIASCLQAFIYRYDLDESDNESLSESDVTSMVEKAYNAVRN